MNYWQDKKVALLGGANMIGTHLARRLVQLGVKGLRISDDLSAGKFDNIKSLLGENVEFKYFDLREPFDARGAVRDADIVFHLASQHGGRGYVAGHSVELWNNLELDTTIFRACSDHKVQKVIFSSSACAYPISMQTNRDIEVYLNDNLDIDYKNLKQADGPYGMEKLVGEAMLDAYIERGDFKGCSTRSFPVYGPLINESHAIAAFIAKTMLRQDPFEIWGDGLQIRNWTYVEDNVSGALLAAEHLDRGAINIGVEDRMTPLMACEKIWSYFDWRPGSIRLRPDKPVGPRNRVADATKLKALGWSPKYTLDEGLKDTIEWYLSTHDVNELRESLERKMTER